MSAVAYTATLVLLWRLQERQQDHAEKLILDGVTAKLVRFVLQPFFK